MTLDTLKNRYQYIPQQDLICRNQFNELYKATDTLLDRTVLLRFAQPGNKSANQKGLIQEVQQLTRLKSKAVVNYLDALVFPYEKGKVEVGVIEFDNAIDGQSFLNKSHSDAQMRHFIISAVNLITDFEQQNFNNYTFSADNFIVKNPNETPQIALIGTSATASSKAAKWTSLGDLVYELLTKSKPEKNKAARTKMASRLPEPYQLVLQSCWQISGKSSSVQVIKQQLKNADVLSEIRILPLEIERSSVQHQPKTAKNGVAIFPPLALFESGKLPNNTDFILPPVGKADQNTRLFLLADGEGSDGSIAAQIMGDYFYEYILEKHPLGEQPITEAYLTEAFKELQEKWHQYIVKNTGVGKLKSGFVLLYIQENQLNFAWQGECRVYHARGGKIIHQSHKHAPSPFGSKDRSIYVRIVQDYKVGDHFLLVTDGILEGIKEEQLRYAFAHSLQTPNFNQLLLKQLKGVCKKNAVDNHSMHLVQIKQVPAHLAKAAPISKPKNRSTKPTKPVVKTKPPVDKGNITPPQKSKTIVPPPVVVEPDLTKPPKKQTKRKVDTSKVKSGNIKTNKKTPKQTRPKKQTKQPTKAKVIPPVTKTPRPLVVEKQAEFKVNPHVKGEKVSQKATEVKPVQGEGSGGGSSRVALVALILFFLLGGAAFAYYKYAGLAEEEVPLTYAELMEKGDDLFDTGAYQAALNVYNEAEVLAVDPAEAKAVEEKIQEANINFLLADAESLMNDKFFDKASEQYENVLVLDTANAIAKAGLQNVFQATNLEYTELLAAADSIFNAEKPDYWNAKTTYLKAVYLNDEDASTLLKKINDCNKRMNRSPQSMEEMRDQSKRYVKATFDFKESVEKGDSLLSIKQYSKASEAYGKAVKYANYAGLATKYVNRQLEIVNKQMGVSTNTSTISSTTTTRRPSPNTSSGSLTANDIVDFEELDKESGNSKTTTKTTVDEGQSVVKQQYDQLVKEGDNLFDNGQLANAREKYKMALNILDGVEASVGLEKTEAAIAQRVGVLKKKKTSGSGNSSTAGTNSGSGSDEKVTIVTSQQSVAELRSLMRRGNFKAAYEGINRGKSFSKFSDKELYSLGKGLEKQTEIGKAIECFRFLADAKDNAGGQVQLGRMYTLIGNKNKAVTNFKRAYCNPSKFKFSGESNSKKIAKDELGKMGVDPGSRGFCN